MKLPLHLLGLALILGALSAHGADRKLVMIAGKPSHGPGEHEFRAGCLLLQKCLEGVPGLHTAFYDGGWPKSPDAFAGADAVFLYADGGDGHPFLQEDHLPIIAGLISKGVGLGLAHYAVEVPKERAGRQFQAWVGGYYETAYSCNPMWSPDYQSFPDHPITRGVKPFTTRDEWYIHMRFRPEMQGVLPILVAKPSDQVRRGPYVYPPGPYPHIIAASGQDEIMMWAVERPDGGRGFGFTGGHYHRNWGNDNVRKLVLNALLWIAKVEVPADGVQSAVSAEELERNLDPKHR